MSEETQVAVIMGSQSDWDTMKHACDVLDELGIPYEKKVVSAHRTPDYMFEYAAKARERGLKVIIAGAGGAAHLPGMVAAKTTVPVIGVPVKSSTLNGLDSLLSIVQMPGGVPVATVAIGKAGATNAGLLAAQILALEDRNWQNVWKNGANGFANKCWKAVICCERGARHFAGQHNRCARRRSARTNDRACGQGDGLSVRHPGSDPGFALVPKFPMRKSWLLMTTRRQRDG